ncbi:MAG TPA: flagellar biosynthesis protein FliR [Parvularcula sp.]|nr:flagellar biosynthesis protein FliR [Parvularcula sp.]HBS34976.1 flagellar biosynthesis protein FliR [Parvularcula sp.]
MTEYFAAIAGLVEAANLNLPLWAGVLARMSAIAFLAPALGELAVPVRVRLAGAIALTMLVAPFAAAPAPAANAAALAAMIGAEAATGLLIGFALRLGVFALQMLGVVTAQVLTLSQLFGPGLSHDQESPISTILIAAGLALACASGLHLRLAASLAESYAAFPFGAGFDFSQGAEFAAAQSGKALSLAFGMAAPFVLLGMVYSVALAAANRAMPQMAAVFVGAPAVIFAGMALFAGAAAVILSRWSEVTASLVAAPLAGLP